MSTEFGVMFVRNGLQGEYLCVDDNPEWIAKLAWVIDNGEQYVDLLGPLLVRRGRQGDWHHYPVPFLFKSDADRQVAAARRHKNPPQKSWVNRKLSLLYRLARRENKLAA